MPYERCGHMGKVAATLVHGTARLPLHECRCDKVAERFTHERFFCPDESIVVFDGAKTQEHVACCLECPYKIQADKSAPRELDARTDITAAAVTRFAKATAKWIAAGSPVRTDSEVNELAKICAECDYFKNGKCTHAMCGCNIKTAEQETHGLAGIVFGGGLFNKLRRQTEACPIGKWG